MPPTQTLSAMMARPPCTGSSGIFNIARRPAATRSSHILEERRVRADVRAMTPPLAKQTLGVLLDERSGFFRDVRLDPAGMEMVLALRSRFGKVKLYDPQKYLDTSYIR